MKEPSCDERADAYLLSFSFIPASGQALLQLLFTFVRPDEDIMFFWRDLLRLFQERESLMSER